MKKKKIKLQIRKKFCVPKWVPPEKRMATYEDYGITDQTKHDDPKWKKVKRIDFRIIVPDEYTRDQLLAAFEFLHDNESVMDNDFLVINHIAHCYLTPEREPEMIPVIIVDPDMFKEAKQKTCPHNKERYNEDGMDYCKECGEMLEVTSWRD